MNSNKLLITGGNGLVGSRIVELLSHSYQFEFINRTVGIDITDKETILHTVKNSEAPIVLHLAAKADVDGCEKEKSLGENSEAWKVNVTGTKNIVDACEQTQKKLIYISTDFVFDGETTPEDGYTEENSPHPINWYAQTKYEGEKIVTQSSDSWIIARIAYPYRAAFEKNDFVRVFKTLLEQGKPLSLITDHIVNATFIDDIATAFDALIKQNSTGVYHVTGSQAVSPYEEGMLIAKIFGLDQSLIGKTTREEFFKDRAKRPFNLKMNNDKISKRGVQMSTFEQGLLAIKRQLNP